MAYDRTTDAPVDAHVTGALCPAWLASAQVQVNFAEADVTVGPNFRVTGGMNRVAAVVVLAAVVVVAPGLGFDCWTAVVVVPARVVSTIVVALTLVDAALPAEVVAPSVFSVAEPGPPQATTIGPMTNSEVSSSVRVSEEVGIVVRFSRRDEWPVTVRRRR